MGMHRVEDFQEQNLMDLILKQRLVFNHKKNEMLKAILNN